MKYNLLYKNISTETMLNCYVIAVFLYDSDCWTISSRKNGRTESRNIVLRMDTNNAKEFVNLRNEDSLRI